MTNITKTSQSVAFNTKNAPQNSVFDAAKTNAKIRVSVQPPQAPKIRLVRPSTPPPASARSIIIKTNGRLNSFEVKPSGGKLLIRTPQGVPIGKMPNTPSVNQFFKVGGAAAIGAGEAAPVAGAGTAGGIFTLGTLATAGLFLLTGGITFFAGMGSAGGEQEDLALKQLKKRGIKQQKPQAKQGINPQLKPPAPLIGVNPDQPPSFIPATKQRKFVPQIMPRTSSQPTGYMPVPAVPKIPTIKAVPVSPVAPLPVVTLPKNVALPKGGSLKTPVVKGVKLVPPAPNYVGARRDVKANTQSTKKAKGHIRASGETKDGSATQNTQAQLTQQTTAANNDLRAKRLKSTKIDNRHGRGWEGYYEVYDKWCTDNKVNSNQTSDPLNPDDTQPVGFHKVNGVTVYKDASGQYLDASIFDRYLDNTLTTFGFAPAIVVPSPSKKDVPKDVKQPVKSASQKASRTRAAKSIKPKTAKPKAEPKPKTAPKPKKIKAEKPAGAKTPKVKTPKPPKDPVRQQSALQLAKYTSAMAAAQTELEKIEITDRYTNEINQQTVSIYADIGNYRTILDKIRKKLVKQTGSAITRNHVNFTQTKEALKRDKEKQVFKPQTSETLEKADEALNAARQSRKNAVTYRAIQKSSLDKLEVQQALVQPKEPTQGQKVSLETAAYKKRLAEATSDAQRAEITDARTNAKIKKLNNLYSQIAAYRQARVEIQEQPTFVRHKFVSGGHRSAQQVAESLKADQDRHPVSQQASKTLEEANTALASLKETVDEAQALLSKQRTKFYTFLKKLSEIDPENAKKIQDRVENSIKNIQYQ